MSDQQPANQHESDAMYLEEQANIEEERQRWLADGPQPQPPCCEACDNGDGHD